MFSRESAKNLFRQETVSMRTTSEATKKIAAEVKQGLDDLAVNYGLQEACEKTFKNLYSSESLSSEKDLIEYFFSIVWLFQNFRASTFLTKKTCFELTRMAEYALKLLKIKPYSSLHSNLYNTLYRARSIFLGHLGRPWLAAWSLTMADAMDGTNTSNAEKIDFISMYQQANLYYQAGFISDSAVLFQKAELSAQQDDELIEAKLGIVRCLRVFDQTDTALNILAGISSHFSLSERVQDVVAWERSFLLAQRDRNVGQIIDAITVDRKHRKNLNLYYFLLGHLWCYAAKQRSAIGDLPGLAWIRRNLSIETDDRKIIILMKYLKNIEDCYSGVMSIFDKMKEIGDVIADIREMPPTIETAVFLAAVTRWLHRSKQRKSAALVISDYHNISSLLSLGRSQILLNLLEDIGDSLNQISEATRSSNMDRGVQCGLERTFLYLEITGKMFALNQLISENRKENKMSEISIDLWIKVSSFLLQYANDSVRGPIHKFGRIIFDLISLPDEARDNFRAVLESENIVNEISMREVLERELNGKYQDIFNEFDWKPIRCGSGSQVYKARLKTGELVAVKIQHPNLEKTIRQDMTTIIGVLSALRWTFPSVDFEKVKKSVEAIVERELDFQYEISSFNALSSIAHAGMIWRLPKIFLHYSTSRVLVSELIDGKNLSEYADTANNSEKVQIIKAINQFFLLSALDRAIMFFDLDPANIIVSNQYIYMIDLSWSFNVSDSFLEMYREFTQAKCFIDSEQTSAQIETLRRADIFDSRASVSNVALREFVFLLMQQMRWDVGHNEAVRVKLAQLFFTNRINEIFASKSPEFILVCISQLLTKHTIQRLRAIYPDNFEFELIKEVLTRSHSKTEDSPPDDTILKLIAI